MNRKISGTLIPPENSGEQGLFVHDLAHDFKVDDKVTDITAVENGWPDFEDVVVAVDGSNVKVRYSSGTERSKMHINLQKRD
jgi:hypothetical protein